MGRFEPGPSGRDYDHLVLHPFRHMSKNTKINRYLWGMTYVHESDFCIRTC